MEPVKNLNYSRDDVFIISVNNSADEIEKIEASLYLIPNNIFILYGRISALYSKTHPYIKKDRNIAIRLMKIQEGLFNKDFIRDLNDNKINSKTNQHFLKLVGGLILIYREMTEDFTMGIFPKIEIQDTRPGMVKQR